METKMVNIKINNVDVQVPAGSTILEAARSVGIDIPTLCYLKDINAIGACRLCVVEVKGARSLVTACVYPVNEGMEVFTNTPAVRKSRKTTLELIISNHRRECLTCSRSQNCELQKFAKDYGIEEWKFASDDMKADIEDSSPHLVRDNSKCILCRRCVAACKNMQKISVIGPIDRGFDTHIGCAFDEKLANVACIDCGQCINVCPTGALKEKSSLDEVRAAIADPDKHVVVGTAPSVRAALGEDFGMAIGTNVEGKMVAALRRLGFNGVFDVDTAADVTIMEEGTELLHRLENGGALPLITSCSPGWIRFCEYFYPEFIPNLSSCKSPQQMFGALMKTYYAEKMGIPAEKIYVVTVMPCTAKKYEIGREDQQAVKGLDDVDATITTRELAEFIKDSGLRFTELPDETFDPAFGIASGAGHIFGASGGVMEAALRTVSEVVTGKALEKLEFHEVRGIEGVKEAEYDLNGTTVKVAVVSGTANARKLLDAIKAGEKEYHFVEIMACPGGCVNGGGQPIQPASVRNFVDLRAERAKALYSEDGAMALRKSHENPIVKELYDEYLEKPGSHKAHGILHTTYTARKSIFRDAN
ncbi:MAG: iron hydrogenase small subunit [Clostridia bacterium]|nr:iron hydrogenase small subunit [Clostridia bacterium]